MLVVYFTVSKYRLYRVLLLCFDVCWFCWWV